MSIRHVNPEPKRNYSILTLFDGIYKYRLLNNSERSDSSSAILSLRRLDGQSQSTPIKSSLIVKMDIPMALLLNVREACKAYPLSKYQDMHGIINNFALGGTEIIRSHYGYNPDDDKEVRIVILLHDKLWHYTDKNTGVETGRLIVHVDGTNGYYGSIPCAREVLSDIIIKMPDSDSAYWIN